jgi:hypothetical protein
MSTTLSFSIEEFGKLLLLFLNYYLTTPSVLIRLFILNSVIFTPVYSSRNRNARRKKEAKTVRKPGCKESLYNQEKPTEG